MPLSPVGGPAPGPGLSGLPADDAPGLPDWLESDWLESDWLESDWLESERDLDREEPPEKEMFGLWPDPPDGADLDPSGPEALGAGFTRDLPSDPPVGFAAGGPLDSMSPGPALAGFADAAFECDLGKLSDDELVGACWRRGGFRRGRRRWSWLRCRSWMRGVVVRRPGPNRPGSASTCRKSWRRRWC